MNKYSCIYYETAGGGKPVEDFIEGLNEDSQDKFFFKKGLLEDLGPQLRYPHTDKIGEGIFELRFKGKEGQVRVLFFFYYKKQMILTNGFVKKTKKTPKKEIKTAKQRKKDFLDRQD